MILILFISCLEEQTEILEISQQDTKLTLVKNWFESNKSELRVEDSRDNFRTEFNELILPFFEKEPDWDKFHIFQFPDGREVYEINLANTELYFPDYLLDSLPGMIPQKSVVQNIMFVENTQTQRFDPLIVRYYPDNKESLREFGEIFYGMIDMDWSGMVDIWTYDERHFISFTIRDGAITSSMQTLPKDPESHQDYGGNLLTTEPCREVVTQRNYVGSDGVVTVSYTVTYQCSGGSGSGSSSGSSYGNHSGNTYTYTGPYQGGGSGSYGSVGGTTYTPPTITSPNIKIEKIDMEDLDDCHQNIINDLIGSTQQEFHRIFRKFYGDKPLPSNYNVKFQYGVCSNSQANACASSALINGWATITFNPNNIGNATDLSFARTVIHEILHAYLLFEAAYPSNCDLNCLLNKYFDKYNSNNPSHHNLFAETKFLNDIATELRNYAAGIGYNVNALGDQFFKDMAWGGLTRTDVFNSLSASDKTRIINRLNAENTGDPKGNIVPIGIKACN
ncbi:hypothetical protein [Arthrospiribacter ruber]|uniref:hypothetical protein n=1 Tax=Arthrospiribacter ruber TaxID=2487934 RepID=UPI001C5BD1AD|nr:hypothetical protein [Arthrospiribacter ruber]